MSMRHLMITSIFGETLGLKITDDELEDVVIDLDFNFIDVATIDGIAITWTGIDSTWIYMCGDELLFTETMITNI